MKTTVTLTEVEIKQAVSWWMQLYNTAFKNMAVKECEFKTSEGKLAAVLELVPGQIYRDERD